MYISKKAMAEAEQILKKPEIRKKFNQAASQRDSLQALVAAARFAENRRISNEINMTLVSQRVAV